MRRLRQRPGPLGGAAIAAFAVVVAAFRPWNWGGDETPSWRLEPLGEPSARASTPGTSPLPVAGGPPGEACERSIVPGVYRGSVVFEGEERSFRLSVPTSTGFRQPLVLNFHGESRSAEDQDSYSGLANLAGRAGFLLLSPEGSGNPSGWTIPGVYREGIADDVGFVLELLDGATSELCVDPDRLYATGLSNGAEMAALLACVAPGRFAAIASVAGLVFPGCEDGDVAVLGIHGTDDWNVPYDLGLEAAGDWARYHGCVGASTERVSDSVSLDRYSGCSGGDVAFVTIEGGGHTWPGATSEGGVGPVSMEVSASELIWQFFVEHPQR